MYDPPSPRPPPPSWQLQISFLVHVFLPCLKVHWCHLPESRGKGFPLVFVLLLRTYFIWYECFPTFYVADSGFFFFGWFLFHWRHMDIFLIQLSVHGQRMCFHVLLGWIVLQDHRRAFNFLKEHFQDICPRVGLLGHSVIPYAVLLSSCTNLPTTHTVGGVPSFPHPVKDF